MNFVVYPVYKKKTYSDNKIVAQPLINIEQKKTSLNKKKTSIICNCNYSKSSPVPEPDRMKKNSKKNDKKLSK